MAILSAEIELGPMRSRIEGKDACEIIRKASVYQDFECLIRMARAYEGVKKRAEVDRLEAFYDKYLAGTLTAEDLRGLDVRLSIGNVRCLGLTETDGPDAP